MLRLWACLFPRTQDGRASGHEGQAQTFPSPFLHFLPRNFFPSLLGHAHQAPACILLMTASSPPLKAACASVTLIRIPLPGLSSALGQLVPIAGQALEGRLLAPQKFLDKCCPQACHFQLADPSPPGLPPPGVCAPSVPGGLQAGPPTGWVAEG